MALERNAKKKPARTADGEPVTAEDMEKSQAIIESHRDSLRDHRSFS